MDSTKQALLHKRYLASIPAKLADLRVARQDLVDGLPHASSEIRRLSHGMAGSGASHGFANISLEASKVEEAADHLLLESLDRLLRVLEAIEHSEHDSTARALIIEDDLEMAQLIRDGLLTEVSEIHIAVTAAAARGLLDALNFDLVVLDLFLPDSDGRELLVELRSRVRSSRIPVIVITGAGSGSSVRRECIELGVEHYFQKPIDVETVQAVARTTIDRRSRSLQETRTDWLTGLRNRAGFQEAMELLHSMSQRSGQSLGLALLELDHFEGIIDEHGQALGDLVLQRVAALLRRRLHPHHVASRRGPTEFMVALPNTSGAEGKALLEQVLEELRAAEFSASGPSNVTFSAGLVEVEESLDRALFEVDRHLHAAKLLGRARVVHTMSVGEPEHRILVVDDDPLARELIAEAIGSEAKIDVANDSPMALEMVRHTRYAAIILDWMLPGMPGDMVLMALREQAKTRHTPVLMLTLRGDAKNVERAFELGADDYVTKPFRPRELLARVRRLILRDRPRSSP